MQNLKIRVNNEAESKEAQELFFKLGGKWGIGGRNIQYTNAPFLYLEDGIVIYGDSDVAFNMDADKEITLPELRAMANQDQDDPFLTPETTLNDQYSATVKSYTDNFHVSSVNITPSKEIHGTVKAKPDFNFGAAQAIGSVDATLAERQSTYGNFEDVAFVTESIMAVLGRVRGANGLHDLPHTHRMALYMIASKMARIVNGDFNHLDSWHDIGGYAKLIEKLINEE